MIKVLFILITTFIFLHGKDELLLKQRNVLYVQNLIKIEEKIAENFEKYILAEFSIPTLDDLINDNYLGSNFSVNNIMGSDIAFKNVSSLQLKYAVTNSVANYVKELYNRSLYRNNTNAVPLNSYVGIILQSSEGKNIFELLNSLAETENFTKECTVDLKNSFCNNNLRTIRWYDNLSGWIEFDKKDLFQGNVTVKNALMLSDPKINNLSVGSYIYIENSSKYIKLIDNEIMKVE